MEDVFRRATRFAGGDRDLDLDIERLRGRPRLGGGLCEKLSRRAPRRGGERKRLSDASRALLGGVIDREIGRPFRRGGVMDRDSDLDSDRDSLRPLALSFPFPFLGGVLETERLRLLARVLEYDLDRDLDRDEPVYDE